MILSAVSVLVVAQSSSEVPEGLMNNPVLNNKYEFIYKFQTSHTTYIVSGGSKELSYRAPEIGAI